MMSMHQSCSHITNLLTRQHINHCSPSDLQLPVLCKIVCHKERHQSNVPRNRSGLITSSVIIVTVHYPQLHPLHHTVHPLPLPKQLYLKEDLKHPPAMQRGNSQYSRPERIFSAMQCVSTVVQCKHKKCLFSLSLSLLFLFTVLVAMESHCTAIPAMLCPTGNGLSSCMPSIFLLLQAARQRTK